MRVWSFNLTNSWGWQAWKISICVGKLNTLSNILLVLLFRDKEKIRYVLETVNLQI